MSSLFVWFLLTTNGLFVDPIHEVGLSSNQGIALHTSGLFTYGAHTNTFHLRYAYVKLEQIHRLWTWWVTLEGYGDTHIPETNYGYILPNITLYDYGIELSEGGFFVSFRGAAIPRWNRESFLLVPADVRAGNPGEFDASPWYREQPVNASGIRLGWKNEYLYVSYSQGDYRHLIPMGVTANLTLPWFFWKNTVIVYNGEPETYSLEDYHYQLQSSLATSLRAGSLSVLLLEEANFVQREGIWGVRSEQALRWKNWQLGMREIYWNNRLWSTEGGIMYLFEEGFSFGAQISSEGKIYIGARVDF